MSRLILNHSLISPRFLAENLAAENLILFDASMKPVTSVGILPPAVPAYIPGSLRFDYDTHLCDHSVAQPHKMPAPDYFGEEMRKLGVCQGSAIVVYDTIGVYASPRAWWMLRAMGHENVAVLNGGMPAWIQSGYRTTTALASPSARGDFEARPRPGCLVNADDVLKALKDPDCCVVDARSAGRFEGREPEPRPGLRGGHMPGAINVPFTAVQSNGVLHDPDTVRALLSRCRDRRLIFSCGTGVTACIVALAAEQAGLGPLALFEGSWTEWGKFDSGLPVVEGAVV